MNMTSVIEIQKKGIPMHRILYAVFFFQRLLVQLRSDENQIKNTIVILSFLAVCEIIEEIFYHSHLLEKVKVVRIVRYIQSVFASIMLIFLHGLEDSGIMILVLWLMFVIDFLVSVQLENRTHVILILFLVSFPVLSVILTKMTFNGNNHWLYFFFDILMILVVLAGEAILLLDYLHLLNKTMSDQYYELEEAVEKNKNILNMQKKLKKTNEQLNMQKLDLQLANKQIKEANSEMIAQKEILHYIAKSFDVIKISNYITDSIMQVKKLGFCAVYIRENVYLNQHANYVVKTNFGQMQSKIKEHMKDIYLKMISGNEREAVFHENIKTEFPFLNDVNICSVYAKVLELDGDTYGLFLLGDCKKNCFADHMSFYHAVIAQYDIAIGNAKIYNEMQNMARKDGLTGINNRIYFTELFKNAVSRMKKMNGCISVALFDIDKFKSVNDTYGHLAGDEVIKKIAVTTQCYIEKYNGFVCRYGGEEFVAVLPDRKLEVAQSIIEELFEELCRQVVVYNGLEIHMSVSIGLTAYPEVCKNTDDLLKRADWCMYYAKEHGRCQINVDDGSIQRE